MPSLVSCSSELLRMVATTPTMTACLAPVAGDVLAEGTLIWPELVGETAVDDNHRLGVGPVFG